MKIKSYIAFAFTGGVAGMMLLALANAIPLVLVFGVGPVIVGSCVLAVTTQNVQVNVVRTVAAVLLSIPAYLVSFATFAATASFFQHHGVSSSSLLSDLGPDIVLGLVGGIMVAGILLECLAWLLSRTWSSLAALGLIGGGLSSLGCAYVVKVVYFHFAGSPQGEAQLLVLFGPLFIIGGAGTAVIIGRQIEKSALTRMEPLFDAR